MSRLKPVGGLTPEYEAYLQQLRDQIGGNVYETDPYAEVFQLRDNVWALHMPCTHLVGDNWVYLISGPEKALVIDNGYGIGDLKGLCEQLTGQEVLCAVTHSHGDHAGGSPQWDEVYCHAYCADIMEEQFDHYQEFWNRFNHVGEEQHQAYYRPEDVIPFKRCKFNCLPNHGIINLGEDYDIEMIHMGGHTPGLCAFLDKKGTTLYSGDSLFACGTPGSGLGIGVHSAEPGMPHGEFMGIVYYHEQLRKLCSRLDEFDTIQPGHGYVNAPAQVAPDVLSAVECVMANPWTCDKVLKGPRGNVCIKYGGTGDVLFVPEEVAEQLQAAGLPVPEKPAESVC